MTQPRITVDEVKAAYEKCGRKPVRQMWIPSKRSCCPAAAVYIATNPGADVNRLDADIVAHGWACRAYGHDYVDGFTRAVDGCVLSRTASVDEKQGYADGVAVASAIFGETSNQPS